MPNESDPNSEGTTYEMRHAHDDDSDKIMKKQTCNAECLDHAWIMHAWAMSLGTIANIVRQVN